MKNRILLYFLVLVSIFSCKKDIAEFKPTNPFENTLVIEKQFFDLDTLTNQIITGEKGTKIYFNREDFDINENDKVTLELKEYYNRLELISDNLNTVTNKNELLESNGVIYLNLKVGDKKINLKKDKKLRIEFAQKFRKGDRIYNGVLDSLNQITWIDDKETYISFPVFDSVSTRQFGGVETYMNKIISIDSLDYYSQLNIDMLSDATSELYIINWWDYPSILISNLGWINVDKIIEPDGIISYELNLNQSELDNVSTFLIYQDLNSFISDYRQPNNLKFTEIPIKNKTSLVVIAKKRTDIYANRILLNKNTIGNLEIELKKTDSTELEKLLKK
ncbi:MULTISPECIES: hypothetical protein [Winogradskyella]|uniref:hypothetical protein n=1 Tax=Winogradskyella TaxID=286104 RepID=UPI0015CB6610|nr:MULTISPECIES: hypothetical protein [Winogradskyella]QXP78699.1 hypothetical protein H0I32_16070 [Winogradskyella sp. HaHa_3_26]